MKGNNTTKTQFRNCLYGKVWKQRQSPWKNEKVKWMIPSPLPTAGKCWNPHTGLDTWIFSSPSSIAESGLQVEILNVTSQFSSTLASLPPAWDTLHLMPGLTFLICMTFTGMPGSKNKYIYSVFPHQSLRKNGFTSPQTHKITLMVLDWYFPLSQTGNLVYLYKNTPWAKCDCPHFAKNVRFMKQMYLG